MIRCLFFEGVIYPHQPRACYYPDPQTASNPKKWRQIFWKFYHYYLRSLYVDTEKSINRLQIWAEADSEPFSLDDDVVRNAALGEDGEGAEALKAAVAAGASVHPYGEHYVPQPEYPATAYQATAAYQQGAPPAMADGGPAHSVIQLEV